MPFQKQEKKKQYQGLDKVYEFNKSKYYETVNKDNKRQTLKIKNHSNLIGDGW